MSPVYQFAYARSPDQDLKQPEHHPVIIVGAGPVGMTLALDLARRQIPVVLLDDADRIGEGSRAICFAKRTLEIFDRLGVADPMLAKGVIWQKGRVFLENREIYAFDLLPEGGHKMPAFINLQQYYVEKYLVDAVIARPNIDLRWRNRVVAIEQRNETAFISIDTPDGPYRLSTEWLICCDGARSPTRGLLGLEFKGEMFDDQFLIADVKMTADFPTERWFWFDPPFHQGQSALLHKQPDDIWRIDLQLSPDADTEHEKKPEQVVARIERMLGHQNFELEWVSIYKFQCRRLDRFAHGRVVFAGDAAHQVSPFGARGANSGVQDADNLGWKLAAVLKGEAPTRLIDSYDTERGRAADENIGHSTRATDFIAPRSPAERMFRNATLELAAETDFAKRFVNSGRLSTPSAYAASPLMSLVGDPGQADGAVAIGATLPDAPVVDHAGHASWLLGQMGTDFTVVHFPQAEPGAPLHFAKLLVAGVDFTDTDGLAAKRLGAQPGTTIVVRPDLHVAARLAGFQPEEIRRAIDRSMARN